MIVWDCPARGIDRYRREYLAAKCSQVQAARTSQRTAAGVRARERRASSQSCSDLRCGGFALRSSPSGPPVRYAWSFPVARGGVIARVLPWSDVRYVNTNQCRVIARDSVRSSVQKYAITQAATRDHRWMLLTSLQLPRDRLKDYRVSMWTVCACVRVRARRGMRSYSL